MCSTNYLAEKLPIDKTKLPDFLHPDARCGRVRTPHLNGLVSVNKLYEMYGGAKHEDTCKRAVTALTKVSEVSGLALPKLKKCLRDLLYHDPEVMNNLQLAIWCASSLDKGVDSEVIVESTRSLVDLDDINRYNAWRKKWRTYQPRHHKDRASILRAAILSTVHDTAAMADLYALTWLRELGASLDNPSIRYGDKLGKALANDRFVAYWIAIWFAYDSYRLSAEGLVNPMRSLVRRMAELADVEQQYKLGAQQSEYQTYLTAENRFFDVRFSIDNPESSECCCCCKCCKKRQEKEMKELYEIAMQEMVKAGDHPVVCQVRRLKDRQSALVSEMREFIDKVNEYSDFEVILSEDKLFVGEIEECGIESYTTLYIDLVD